MGPYQYVPLARDRRLAVVLKLFYLICRVYL
jgi:hypothetical protein